MKAPLRPDRPCKRRGVSHYPEYSNNLWTKFNLYRTVWFNSTPILSMDPLETVAIKQWFFVKECIADIIKLLETLAIGFDGRRVWPGVKHQRTTLAEAERHATISGTFLHIYYATTNIESLEKRRMLIALSAIRYVPIRCSYWCS